MSTGLIYSDRFLDHDTGPGHPERPDRLRAVVQHLQADGLWRQLQHLPFEPADLQWVHRLHDPAYVDRVHQACEMGAHFIDSADSRISYGSAEIAQLATGGVLTAVDAVMAGELRNAFCAVRPPGHHAEVDRSMGFCLFNHIAIAADYLAHQHGLRRIAIVDFDVHHGNGTQHLLEHRSDILFISTHQHPQTLYPGTGFADETGKDDGRGYTLNLPLAPHTDDARYQETFAESVLPALDRFEPEFLLVSAGYDAAAADPLAHLMLTPTGFQWIVEQLKAVADRHAHGRLVAVLEGGYDLDALAQSVARSLAVLLRR